MLHDDGGNVRRGSQCRGCIPFSDFAEEMKPIFHEGSLFGDPPASTRNCVTQARKLMALRQAAKQITVTETPRHGGAS